ncbi:hypothetical protein B5P43_18305 [Bacillus sp. SRB_336]|nr:hypothetical protein B5P43_18305 [Bacillus sp. SRB_336]
MSESLTQTAKILKLLKRKGEVTNFELSRICLRYSARIKDLRDEGHQIVSEHVKDNKWRFIYVSDPDDQKEVM